VRRLVVVLGGEGRGVGCVAGRGARGDGDAMFVGVFFVRTHLRKRLQDHVTTSNAYQ
jgi:hypothetical protein